MDQHTTTLTMKSGLVVKFVTSRLCEIVSIEASDGSYRGRTREQAARIMGRLARRAQR